MKKCKDCKRKEAKSGGRCWGCAKKDYARRNPLRYCFSYWRSNCLRRGKVVDITFEEWKEFAIEVSYMKKKGITRTGYHIDRKDETLDVYNRDNIQLLTNEENVRKYARFRAEWNPEKWEMEFETTFQIVIEDHSVVPF